MPLQLSPKTVEHVDSLFKRVSRQAVVELLMHQCGNNLPFLQKSDEFHLERVRFAALKLSGGDLVEVAEGHQTCAERSAFGPSEDAGVGHE